MIENYLLYALAQNPTLGSPSEFNVENIIIARNTVDYLGLANQTLKDRQSHPKTPNDIEVQFIFVKLQ